MARSLMTRLGCPLCPQERPSLFGQDGSMPVAAERPVSSRSGLVPMCSSSGLSASR